MATIATIREMTALIPDDELRNVSLAIISQVAERLSRKNQGLWTVDVISEWVQKDASDPALARSLQLLVGRRDAQLLDVHYYFVDPQRQTDGEPIDDEEVAAAYSTGYLIDPLSGKRIENFEHSLFPYFVPAPGLTTQ